MPKSESKTLIYDINHPGEKDAGILSYTEVVHVTFESGSLPEDAVAFLEDSLQELYDGATVTARNYTIMRPLMELLEKDGWHKNTDFHWSKYMAYDCYLTLDGVWEISWVNGEMIEQNRGIDTLQDGLKELKKVGK